MDDSTVPSACVDCGVALEEPWGTGRWVRLSALTNDVNDRYTLVNTDYCRACFEARCEKRRHQSALRLFLEHLNQAIACTDAPQNWRDAVAEAKTKIMQTAEYKELQDSDTL